MSTKHTPGPWEAAKPGDYDVDGIAVYSRNPAGMAVTVASVRYGGTADTSYAAANAALIAAAPDLLAAAENAEKYLASLGKPADSVSRHWLRTAIAKAKGEGA